MTKEERRKMETRRSRMPEMLTPSTIDKVIALYDFLNNAGVTPTAVAFRRAGITGRWDSVLVSATYLLPLYEEDNGAIGVDESLWV